jgi:hypothetical protein
MSHDALLDLLVPLWRLTIGFTVVLVMAVAGRRLLRRGPSRMGRGLIVSGGAALTLVLVGLLIATW